MQAFAMVWYTVTWLWKCHVVHSGYVLSLEHIPRELILSTSFIMLIIEERGTTLYTAVQTHCRFNHGIIKPVYPCKL